MSDEFVSSEEIWSRISSLCPQLRKHIRVHIHVYRGERWYLLQDELSAEHLRVNARAYEVIGRLDGKVTLATIVKYLNANDYPDLEKVEVIDIISRLHKLGAISNVLDKTTVELVKQYRDTRRSTQWRKIISPLLIRVPMLDPDALLERITPKLKTLFSTFAGGLWLLFIIPALVLALQHWDELARAYSTDILKPSNVMLLWLLYPLMKLVHEMAHAVCVKHWGGEVHEMGITFLVLTPIPYVDASAASAFKSKHKRMMVGAAGIMAELFMASIALFVWINASDGWIRDCAFGVFTIGAVSTVLFNANPLLKFDGYYILQDLIEVPNLLSRSAHYYRYLFKCYVLRLQGQVSPVTAKGERRWFLFYGLTSSVYRLFILFFIVVFLSGKFLLLGIALGVWAVIQQIALPLCKAVRFLLFSPEMADQRGRSQRLLLAGAACAVFFIAILPMPSSTRAQGVVWVPQQGEIFVEVSGLVNRVAVTPGEHVQEGQLLATLESPELEKNLAVLKNEILGLDVRSELNRGVDTAEYALLQEDLAAMNRSLAELELQKTKLRIVASTDGVFSPSEQQKLKGRYFAQGDLIAHVVDHSKLVVRVAVPDGKSGRLLAGDMTATVTLAEKLGKRIVASVVNEIPAADHKLPSAALGVGGGGGIAIASSDVKGLTTIESIFHLQLGLPANTEIFGVGERAYVTLKHPAEPLGKRWLRSLRQVFIKTLPV